MTLELRRRARLTAAALVAACLSLGCEEQSESATSTTATSAAEPDNAERTRAEQTRAEQTRASAANGAEQTRASAANGAEPAAAQREVQEAPPDAIAAQHVLITYRGAKRAPADVRRSKAEAEKLAREVADKAKGKADFSALVAEYSEDPGSKERRGSLGKFERDVMHENFSNAAFALKVDEVSDVVETPFGFHVIKRNQ